MLLATMCAEIYSGIVLIPACPGEPNSSQPNGSSTLRVQSTVVEVLPALFGAEKTIVECCNEAVAVEFAYEESALMRVSWTDKK